MCGRIEYIVTNREKLEHHYGATLIEGYTEQGFHYPRYNVPPTAHMPLVVSGRSEEILIGHWGYIPSWAKEPSKTRQVINARAETILEKPYFKSSALHQRCLIAVTGFFEWKRTGKVKTPYRFHRNGEIFSLGGVFTTVKDEDGLELPHFALITTHANDLMAPVHDRIPVIIEDGSEDAWLDDGLTAEEIKVHFTPVKSDYLIRDQISSLVNNPINDTPEILKPVSQ